MLGQDTATTASAGCRHHNTLTPHTHNTGVDTSCRYIYTGAIDISTQFCPRHEWLELERPRSLDDVPHPRVHPLLAARPHPHPPGGLLHGLPHRLLRHRRHLPPGRGDLGSQIQVSVVASPLWSGVLKFGQRWTISIFTIFRGGTYSDPFP